MIEDEVSILPLVPHPNRQFEVICKSVRNLGTTFDGGRFISRQLRTAVPVCNIVPGAFTPVLAKHSKSFSLIDCISVGVDRMQRNFHYKQLTKVSDPVNEGEQPLKPIGEEQEL